MVVSLNSRLECNKEEEDPGLLKWNVSPDQVQPMVQEMRVQDMVQQKRDDRQKPVGDEGGATRAGGAVPGMVSSLSISLTSAWHVAAARC